MHDAPAPSSAIAKARLLQVALNNASRAKLSVTAHALLAHILSDAWLTDDGWASHTSQRSYATRLGLSVETIRRTAGELDAAGVALYRSGRGSRRSRFVVPSSPWGSTPHPRGEDPSPARGSTPHPRGDIPLPGISPPAGRQPPPNPAAAAGVIARAPEPPGAAPELTPAQDALRAAISTRPPWLAEGHAWIDPRKARELARSPATTIDTVSAALSAARERRRTLTNPAGFVIRNIEQPDEELVRQCAARRARVDAWRARHQQERR
ncbi:MAG: hypothetical protein AB7V47_14310 [Phycisphaerales bacterium]